MVANRKIMAFTVNDWVLNLNIEKIANNPNPIPTPISIFVNNNKAKKHKGQQ